MFKNKIIRYGTFAMLLAIIAYSYFGNDAKPVEVLTAGTIARMDETTYATEIEAQRKEKQSFFRDSEDSPIEKKESFEGLDYFLPNQDYRVLARLTPYEGEDKALEIPYTDGTDATYERFAYADFTINDVPQRLLLLKNEGIISVLFRDATSGKTTYGGGRYIDIPAEKVREDVLVIDFNEAYNPYCAYAPNFACPLPPAENTMTAAIEAGEKFDAEKH